jgi:pimeloyl-ACP methyl ester carboxylesterase
MPYSETTSLRVYQKGENVSDIVDPALRDERISTVFVDANGLRFEVDQCGDGKKLAICLHGFPEHSFSWRYQLPMLADLGYKAWAPNMRGYGNTTRPPFVEDYAMDNLLADVAELIDAAGCEETVLIGHDWGAAIAWQFAIRKVRPLTHLIICNVPHPGPMMRELRGAAQLKKSWYMFMFQIPWLPETMLGRRGAAPIADIFSRSSELKEQFPPAVLDVYRKNAAQPGALNAMINYYRMAFRGRGDRTGELPQIDTPTLMVWGEEDMALTKESTYGTEKWVPNLTMRYLPGISHWVQQEAPDTVNAMINAYLTGQPVPEMSWEVKLSPPSGDG